MSLGNRWLWKALFGALNRQSLLQDQGGRMLLKPRSPGRQRRDQRLQLGAVQRTVQRLPEHLAPDAAGLVVPPGLSPFVESPLHPQRQRLSFPHPFVHKARVAKRAPRDRHRYPAHHVVHDLVAHQRLDGVRAGVAVDLHRQHHLFRCQGDVVGRRQARLVDRLNPVPQRPHVPAQFIGRGLLRQEEQRPKHRRHGHRFRARVVVSCHDRKPA